MYPSTFDGTCLCAFQLLVLIFLSVTLQSLMPQSRSGSGAELKRALSEWSPPPAESDRWRKTGSQSHCTEQALGPCALVGGDWRHPLLKMR